MTLQSVILSDFSGGWNSRDSPLELRANESPEITDFSLTTRGALVARKGRTQFDTSGFPAGKKAEHLRAWVPGGNNFLMASVDGTIYLVDGGGVLTSRVAGTAGSVWMMEDMQELTGTQYLWAVNGVDAPRRIRSDMAVVNWTAMPVTLADYHIIRVWRNRMIAIKKNSNRIFLSDIGDPQTFGASNFIDVKASDDDEDFITWAEVLGDNLLVFKKTSVWSFYAEPPSPATRQIGGPGCEERFQSAVMGGRCYYWNRNGVYSTDGETPPREESGPIQNFIQDEVSLTGNERVFAGRDRKVFVACKTQFSLFNDVLLELSPDLHDEGSKYEGGPWVRHTLPVSAGCTLFINPDDVLMVGLDDVVGGYEGIFKAFDQQFDDFGPGPNPAWACSWTAIVPGEKLERLRRVNAFVATSTLVNFHIKKDFATSDAFSQLVSVTAPSGAQVMVRPETRGRYHQVRIAGFGSGSDLSIFSVELVYRGGKEHE